MTCNISLLMFTCNDINKAIGNLTLTEPYVEEIIIIDSSNHEQKEMLKKYSEKCTKIKVLHVPSLGYPEPYRMYGINKCHNPWIFLLDADEEPSAMLLKHLEDMIETSKKNYINTLYIRRYEDGISKGFFTQQLRIFKKGEVIWRGLLHEHPLASNPLAITNEGLYLIHHHENNINRYYYKIQDTFLIESPLKTFARSVVLNIKNGKSPEFSALSPKKLNKQDAIIRTCIKREGITRYLNLDVEAIVDKLEEKYRDEPQGIDLLIKLLREKQIEESK